MKAEDLMIGDWVVEHDRGYNSDGTTWESDETARITAINEYGVDTERNYHLRYDEIEPIPLTPEILEKNTSESNKNVFGGMNYTLNTDYFIENRGDRFCLSRRMAGHKYSTFWVCDIHYVHELQHALRLCKIDLEINI